MNVNEAIELVQEKDKLSKRVRCRCLDCEAQKILVAEILRLRPLAATVEDGHWDAVVNERDDLRRHLEEIGNHHHQEEDLCPVKNLSDVIFDKAAEHASLAQRELESFRRLALNNRILGVNDEDSLRDEQDLRIVEAVHAAWETGARFMMDYYANEIRQLNERMESDQASARTPVVGSVK